MTKDKPQFDINVDYDEETGTIHDHCTSRGFPLGGIGTGGFSIFTDGGFGKFRTNHNWFKSIDQAEYPKGTFCAVWCKSGGKKHAKLLRRDFQGGEEYNDASNIQHTAFHGTIPVFEMGFRDEEIPLKVRLSGFTGLIPHNVKDSSLPVAFFQAELTNPLDKEIEASFLFSFENILGIGGSGGWKWVFPFNGPVTYNSREGNYNESYEQGNLHGITYKTRQDYDPKDPRRRVVGQFFLISDVLRKASGQQKDLIVTKCPAWNSNKDKIVFWEQFRESGTIDLEYSLEGEEMAGAIAIKTKLNPKEQKTLNFYLIWWMPYYVIEKRQRLRKFVPFINHKGKNYGHYWMNHFSMPQELIDYAVNERERISTQSRELLEIINQATLPAWLKTYILNSTDSMLIDTVLTKEGNYYMMEGVPWDWPPGALTGTVDQRLISHVYSALFYPTLDKNELDSFYRLTEDGRVPHGNGHADVALGTYKVPYGQPIRIFNRTNQWIDLPQSFILQVGKHVLQSKDLTLLRDFWDKIPDMMSYLDQSMVNDVPEGITTYDYMKYHPCFVYTATLHLATLKMVTYLAELLKTKAKRKDPQQAEELTEFINHYQEQYEATNQAYLKRLWRTHPEGGYFKTCETRNTIFTSALAGDWISRLCGLGPVVNYQKALSQSRWQKRLLVDSHTYSELEGKKTRPLIYREANFDGNEMPVKVLFHKTYHANNPYQVSAYQGLESIYLGRVKEGLEVIQMIWGKAYHEGFPWNLDHWGMDNHVYMAHPILWAVLHALTGIAYNAFEEKLTISPQFIPNRDNYKIPVFFPNFWILVKYSRKMDKIQFEILKNFKPYLKIKKVVRQHPNGEEDVYNLDKLIKIKKGITFSVILTE
ncbi:MAG: GH116 family glycosyl-hydrolase [Promethearchaeia archaeon]